MPVPTTKERIGSRLQDKYLLERVVASGGMGVVYAGTHAWTQRPVAVKVLCHACEDPRVNTERFIREARAAASLHHPNVVDVLDMGVDEFDMPYLVMELLEGETLGQLLKRRPRLSLEETLHYLLPVFGALAVAHEAGIVHRDLKPANVMLCRERERVIPKLLDFGVAKVADDASLTKSGTVLGTPAYMSPEQALGAESVGRTADVWAMAVILYRCLGGELPFRGASSTETLFKIVNAAPRRLAEVAPDVSAQLEHAVHVGLRKAPEDRYADIPSFARALALAAKEEALDLPVHPEPIGLPDWPAWLSGGAGEVDTVDFPPPTAGDSGDAAREEAVQPQTLSVPLHLSDTLLSPAAVAGATPEEAARPPRRSRGVGVALLALALGSGAAWYLWSARSPGAFEPATPLPPPAGSTSSEAVVVDSPPAETAAETVEAAPVAQEEPPPQPPSEPTAQATDEGAAEAASPARPTARPRKRGARRARQSKDDREDRPAEPAAAPTPSGETKADPFELRTEF